MSVRVPSTDISKLSEHTQYLYHELMSRVAENELPFKLYEAVRSQARQDYLYASGRTRPGPIITKARRSKHTPSRADLGGEAFDLILDFDHKRFGKRPDVRGALTRPRSPWSTGADRHIVTDDEILQQWLMLGVLGESVGLKWGGRWKRKKADLIGWDPYHFELP